MNSHPTDKTPRSANHQQLIAEVKPISKISQLNHIPEKPMTQTFKCNFPMDEFNNYFKGNFLNMESLKAANDINIRDKLVNDNFLAKMMPEVLDDINLNATVRKLENNLKSEMGRKDVMNLNLSNPFKYKSFTQVCEENKMRFRDSDLDKTLHSSSNDPERFANKTLVHLLNELDDKEDLSCVLKGLDSKSISRYVDQSRTLNKELKEKTDVTPTDKQSKDSLPLFVMERNQIIPDKFEPQKLRLSFNANKFGDLFCNNCNDVPLENSKLDIQKDENLDETVSRYIKEQKQPADLMNQTIDPKYKKTQVKMPQQSKLPSYQPLTSQQANAALANLTQKETATGVVGGQQAKNETGQTNQLVQPVVVVPKNKQIKVTERVEIKEQKKMPTSSANVHPRFDANPKHVITDRQTNGRSRYSIVSSLNQSFMTEDISKKNSNILSNISQSRNYNENNFGSFANKATLAQVGHRVSVVSKQPNIVFAILDIILTMTSMMIIFIKTVIKPSQYSIQFLRENGKKGAILSVKIKMPFNVIIEFPHATYNAVLKSLPVIAFLILVFLLNR